MKPEILKGEGNDKPLEGVFSEVPAEYTLERPVEGGFIGTQMSPASSTEGETKTAEEVLLEEFEEQHPWTYYDLQKHHFDWFCSKLSSQSKELAELRTALKGIENLCDNQNPTHEDIWRIANAALPPPPTNKS